MLNVAITASMDNIRPIREFLPNAPQHVAVHRVDCSCYLIFYVVVVEHKSCLYDAPKEKDLGFGTLST